MTLTEAKKLQPGNILHHTGCTVKIGPRGGRTEIIERWRVIGIPKVWKTQLHRVSISIKFGMYDFYTIYENEVHLFHRESQCPLKNIT